MAIEPLGSVMSVQSQTVQKVEAAKPVATSTEAVAQSVGNAVDMTTAAVAKTESNSDGSGEGNNREQGQPSNEQIRQAVEQLNKNIKNSEMQFGIHEATNRVTIKIIDKDSKEVIKELPPEKTLDMIAKVWEIAGLLVDEKR